MTSQASDPVDDPHADPADGPVGTGPVADAARRLLALPDLTTLLADVLDDHPEAGAVLTVPLLPRTSARRLCGPAAVLLLRPAGPDERISHDPLLARAVPGTVGVVDAGARAADPDGPASVLGGRLARRGLAAGVAGYVVHGAVRDLEDLDALGLPVWSSRTHPAGARRTLTPDPDATEVTLGGETVRQGDLVAADTNGVVVVRAEAAEEVCGLAEKAAAQEAADEEAAAKGRRSAATSTHEGSGGADLTRSGA